MWRVLVVGVLFCGSAHAASLQKYALICSAPCVAPDGTTQPAGTLLPGMVTLWDGVTPWTPPSGFRAVPYTGQAIYQPTVIPTVPATVDMWRLKIVLANTPSKMGHTGKTALDDANAVAATQSAAIQLAWTSAPDASRSSPSINALASGIGFTQADIDAAFIAAQAVNY